MTKAKSTKAPAKVAPKAKPKPKAAAKPRVVKRTRRKPPPPPPPPPRPDKLPVEVKNVENRPIIVGVAYLSPGAVREERWATVKAAAKNWPQWLKFRELGTHEWQEVEG